MRERDQERSDTPILSERGTVIPLPSFTICPAFIIKNLRGKFQYLQMSEVPF